ncbi:MAG: GerMN domain-containing protein [Acidobacteriota bacterium]|nr:GerMN domain-containing protein [Acidobacteriota bacterium]
MRRAQVLSLAILAIVAFTGGCRKKGLSPNLNAENKVAVRPVTLFFEGPEMLLVRETRNVALPENPGGALSVVARELLKGSANAGVPHIFPIDTVVRAAFLLPDGTAFVDLGGQTLTQGWSTGSHEELMAVYSVVQTITTNFPEAKRVRILVNDEPAETLAGHVNLGRSLTSMPVFVAR